VVVLIVIPAAAPSVVLVTIKPLVVVVVVVEVVVVVVIVRVKTGWKGIKAIFVEVLKVVLMCDHLLFPTPRDYYNHSFH